MIAVRDAELADADAIGSIHVRCWQHAYVGLVPEELLDSLDEEQHVARWCWTLDGGQPTRGSTLVAIDGSNQVTGFAQVGSTQDGTGGPTLGELYALYLAPERIGTGVGRVLLAAATDRLRDAGFSSARLDVLPANARARYVYEVAGWRAEGEPWIVNARAHQLPHQRYVRQL